MPSHLKWHCKMNQFEIRADYDRETIVVYQAYRPAIAEAAVAAQRFVPPFSLTRMTWIKPSFRWMMHRSGWASKPGQEHVLAVRITRAGWEDALSQAVLSSPLPHVYGSHEQWREAFDRAAVRVQWDPEYSLQDEKLDHRSIQVGLSRDIIGQYVNDWTVEIRDLSSLAREMSAHLRRGHVEGAQALMPPEAPYPLDDEIAKVIGASR
jgi:hypothetical protein